jgi:iron-sulfur cluster assembly protein
MADPAAAPAAVADRPLTLEEKKAAARARARAARQAEQAGEAFVTISPAAAAYIRESAQAQGRPEGVRLRILAGGCSGLEYKLDLLEVGETAGAGDREVASNGVTMLMDLKSAIHVTGSVIDYEQGLLRRGFRINNPNATSTCSCGDSFGAA